MVVDRGPIDPGTTPCQFAQKVWNAQRAGARAVIVVNFEDKMTTMEAPDDDDETSYAYLKNITSEILDTTSVTTVSEPLQNASQDTVHEELLFESVSLSFYCSTPSL